MRFTALVLLSLLWATAVAMIACRPAPGGVTDGATIAPTALAAQAGPTPQPVAAIPMPLATAPPMPTPTATSTATAPPASTATASPTPTATATTTITPTIDATPTYWPTVTRQVLPEAVAAGLPTCAQRPIGDDLLMLVTQQFSLPQQFAPDDLVPLSDHFSSGVTVGLPNTISASILEPLTRIIEVMRAEGLQPSILSGYRSYGEQALAWKWWESQYPDRVAIMSARPGHSEHQLGTTVDFGSPELNHLFHVDFDKTAEGLWLVDHAYLYGFTMSYPADTYDITGFKYEPWHYRYVGVELASALYRSGQILTEWQLSQLPPPCVP